MFTDEKGRATEVTEKQFEEIKLKFPAIAKFLEDPDTMITDELIIKAKERDRWEKLAKKIMVLISKVKGSYLFAQPVDIKKFQGIDDYYRVIKKPMDF